MNRLFICFLVLLFLNSCSKDEDILESASSNEDIGEQYYIHSNGHEYVDLGLSTLWATCCNIGAYSYTDIGNKYAFGELSVKNEYTISNYIGGNNDVAKKVWGGDWRIPSNNELS